MDQESHVGALQVGCWNDDWPLEPAFPRQFRFLDWMAAQKELACEHEWY